MEHPYPRGTKVRKINSVPGEDSHEDGAMATVVNPPSGFPTDTHYLGPLNRPGDKLHGVYGYFVEWDDTPSIEVFISSNRVEAL